MRKLTANKVMHVTTLSNCDSAEIENLLTAAFGTDRRGRTAYLLRAGLIAIPALSFGILNEAKLVGSIQCWPVMLSPSADPLILVGPVAVSPEFQNQGIGRALMKATLDAAALRGNVPMVMIGDPEYYERFGFTAGAAAGWTLPGPWDPQRLLVRNIHKVPLPTSGMIGPDITCAL